MTAPLLPALPGYEDPQLIAHGTTALVFRAIQTALNRPVAIKVITSEGSSGSVPVNVERELATTVALSSQPHIVSIIDTGVTPDDRRYIVMEYCEGGSYAQILRQRGPLPVDDVVEVGIKIGEALHAAHEAGIVHRDVKPSNILRSRFGPALTDFGIARAPDELGNTLTREMMTPHHASPEALLHQAQSGPSDIYSLASTLWTLLVGHPPFVDPAHPHSDMYLFRDRVLHEPLPAMPRDDVPAWLVTELHRAMSKLPAQRHPTALEFAEALRRGSLGLAPTPAPTTAGTSASPLATAAGAAGGRVHTPGMPATAWPAPQAPVPPVTASAFAPPPAQVPGPASPAAASQVGAAPQANPAWTTAPTREAPAVRAAPSAMPPGPSAPPTPVHDGPLYRPRAASAHLTSPVHPLGDRQHPAQPPPPVEEGGWLGPAVPAPPPITEQPIDEPLHPAQRIRSREVPAPSSGRRGGLIAVVVGVVAIALASGTLLFFTSRRTPAAQPSPSTPPLTVTPSLITAGTTGAPTDLHIEKDEGTSVTLVWTDPTGGAMTFVAVQRMPAGQQPRTQTIAPGSPARSVTFTDLVAGQNYCFAVGAVITVNNVAFTPDVCTRR